MISGSSIAAVLTALLALSTGMPIDATEPQFLQQLTLPGAQDMLGFPSSVTADLHANEVFVCDRRMNRILIFDSEGVFTYEINGGETFRAPQDLAVDPNGFLLIVANYENKAAVLELDFDGLFVRQIELSPQPEGLIESIPSSVALSPKGDRLFVVDDANARLWITDRSGTVQSTVDLAAGLSEGERNELMLGHVDVYGERVLVSDATAGLIRMFDLDGAALGHVGTKGGAPCKLGRPMAAALDAKDDLLLIDQQKMVISRWQQEGNRCLAEYWGIGMSPGFLYYPLDIALDNNGRLYVSQGFQGRVQMYEGLAPAASN